MPKKVQFPTRTTYEASVSHWVDEEPQTAWHLEFDSFDFAVWMTKVKLFADPSLEAGVIREGTWRIRLLGGLSDGTAYYDWEQNDHVSWFIHRTPGRDDFTVEENRVF